MRNKNTIDPIDAANNEVDEAVNIFVVAEQRVHAAIAKLGDVINVEEAKQDAARARSELAKGRQAAHNALATELARITRFVKP